MNFKKMKKRFFSLSRGNGGFTLVELIVVIAILAILGGVAVPAYSGYVEKANMGADQTLVGEVAHALSLYYYKNGGSGGGYVVLKPNGAEADPDVGTPAMVAAFGEGWEDSLALKYDKWSDDGLLGYVLENAESADLVANSTFLTTASPDGLMNAVTNLTSAATDVIKAYGDKGNDVSAKLSDLLGEDFVTKLNNTGVTAEDDEYETVISNLLVGEFAKNMNGSTVDAVMSDQLTGMALMYAELYAYCETTNDTTTMESLNSYLAAADDMDELSIEGLSNYLSSDRDFMEGFLTFAGTDENPGQGQKDIEAALEILGAVDFISGNYSKEELADPNLYSSDLVSRQLNDYINAVKAVANLDTTGLNVGEKDVTIFLAGDGTVSALPITAYLAE